jgi:hypothetical protein
VIKLKTSICDRLRLGVSGTASAPAAVIGFLA